MCGSAISPPSRMISLFKLTHPASETLKREGVEQSESGSLNHTNNIQNETSLKEKPKL